MFDFLTLRAISEINVHFNLLESSVGCPPLVNRQTCSTRVSVVLGRVIPAGIASRAPVAEVASTKRIFGARRLGSSNLIGIANKAEK